MSRLVSPTQRKVLEALVAGSCIHLVHHSRNRNDSAFLSDGGFHAHQTISVATLEALRVQGWLVNTTEDGWRWRGSRYIISDKGREQLRKEQEADAHAGKTGREKQ